MPTPLANFFDVINVPVTVIVGLLTIAGVIAGKVPFIRNVLARLRNRWQNRNVHRVDKARRLTEKAGDYAIVRTDKERLRMLKKASSLYRAANDGSREAWVLLETAKLLNGLLSPVRDDASALKTALVAASLAERVGESGLAAEAYELAGDLCFIPDKLRNEEAARRHYDASARCYRLLDLEDAATNVAHRLIDLKGLLGDRRRVLDDANTEAVSIRSDLPAARTVISNMGRRQQMIAWWERAKEYLSSLVIR